MKAKIIAMAFALIVALGFTISVHAATPEELSGMYGGDMKIAVKDTVLDLNPNTATDEASWSIINVLYDSLGRLDPVTLEVIPWVAESWTVDAVAGEVTVELNPDAVWHDGSSVTASDVKYTYETFYGGYSVTVVSSTEVVFSFTGGGGKFMTEGLQKPLVKSGVATPTEGCGPFAFVERAAGDHVTVSAYDGYFKDRPYLDTIEYIVYPDIDAAANALINQTIDSIGWTLYTNDPTDYRYDDETIIDQPHLAVHSNPGLEYLYLGFNPSGELADDDLRKAVSMLINKDLYLNIEPSTEVTHSPMSKYNEPWYNYSIAEINAGYFFSDGRQATNFMPGLVELGRLNYFDRGNDGYREKPDGSPLVMTMEGPSSSEDLRKNTIGKGYQTLLDQVGLDVTYTTTGDPSSADIYLDVGKLSLEPTDIRNIPILADYGDTEITTALDAADEALDQTTRQMYVHQALGLISEKVPFVPLLSYNAIEASNRDRWEGGMNMVGGQSNFWSAIGVHKVQEGSLSASVESSEIHLESGDNATMTVRVLDQSGYSVLGVNVEVTADSGSFESPTGTTDALGTFETTYTAASVTETADIKIEAVAHVPAYQGDTAVTYVTVHPVIETLDVKVQWGTPVIDSGGSTTVSLVIMDESGAYVGGCEVHIGVDHPGATLGTLTEVSDGQWQASFTANVTTQTNFRVTATVIKDGYETGTGFTNLAVRGWGGFEPEQRVNIESIPDVGILAMVSVTLVALLVMAYRRRER